MYGKLAAADLWRHFDLGVPVDLRRVVDGLGLEVVSFPFQGRIKELIVDRVIGVRCGLPRPWFRWCVAHAVGHNLLHVGTDLFLDSWQWASHAKAEAQAEEFASWLLGGFDGQGYSASELGIPDEKLALVRMLSDRSEQIG